jgi:hypothetical protein
MKALSSRPHVSACERGPDSDSFEHLASLQFGEALQAQPIADMVASAVDKRSHEVPAVEVPRLVIRIRRADRFIDDDDHGRLPLYPPRLGVLAGAPL